KGIGGSAPDGAVVIHGFDNKQVAACLPKVKEEAEKKGTEVTIDGDVFIMKDKNASQAMAFTYVGDSTIVGVIGANGTKDGVKAAAKGTSALKTSATFVEMY